MADELARVGAIEMRPDGSVRLLARAYVPRGDQAEKIAILGADTADLIRSIDHNLTCASGDAYFQRRVSYSGLTSDVSRAAQALAQLGLRPGDRVAAFIPNIPETGKFFTAMDAALEAIDPSLPLETRLMTAVDLLRARLLTVLQLRAIVGAAPASPSASGSSSSSSSP